MWTCLLKIFSILCTAPLGIIAVSFGFLKNLLLLTVIFGFPEIIVHRSALWLCFCKLIDDFGLIISSFNKNPMPNDRFSSYDNEEDPWV